MNRIALPLLLGLSLTFTICGCSAEPSSAQSKTTAEAEQPKVIAEAGQARAIAEIEKVGGKVTFDNGHPGQLWVWLQGSKVTDVGLLHLKGLLHVGMLNLNQTAVTDAGLVNLKELTQLKSLDLGRTEVTDAGLEHLKGLTQLEELNLARTKVTDAGLVHLEGLTKLRALDLGATKVTYAGGVKGLQKALAKCTILFGSPAHAITPSKRSNDESLVRLLVVDAVQKDLGLTADQIKKIGDFVKLSQARWRDFIAKLEKSSPPGQVFSSEEVAAGDQEFQTLSDDYKSEGKELLTKLLALLTAKQNERLKQIEIQAAVAAALERPEIINALQISEEQRKKIEVLKDRIIDERPPPDLRRLDSKERRQKMIEFLKESDKASAAENKLILDVLTPEQRAKFDKLQGKKIELNWPYDDLLSEDIPF